MTTKSFQLRFDITFWLNVLAAVFLILKYLGVLNWDIRWCLLPWIVSLALWLFGKTLVLLGKLAVRRAKAHHPAFQR
jgi:hypothetical protein